MGILGLYCILCFTGPVLYVSLHISCHFLSVQPWFSYESLVFLCVFYGSPICVPWFASVSWLRLINASQELRIKFHVSSDLHIFGLCKLFAWLLMIFWCMSCSASYSRKKELDMPFPSHCSFASTTHSGPNKFARLLLENIARQTCVANIFSQYIYIAFPTQPDSHRSQSLLASDLSRTRFGWYKFGGCLLYLHTT